MPAPTKKLSPPYATYSSFLRLFTKLQTSGIPSRIDPSVFGKASGSETYSVIAALKFLKLIDDEGIPSSLFTDFVNASEQDRKDLMAKIIKAGYPSLFNGSIDISKATAGQFDSHIRDEFEVNGSTVDKIAAFFLAAAKTAEIKLSTQIAERKPTAASPTSNKSKKQRSNSSAPPAAINNQSAVAQQTEKVTEKQLEYRLVDLMSDAMEDPEVMDAIIKVVKFLKTRNASNNNEGDK